MKITIFTLSGNVPELCVRGVGTNPHHEPSWVLNRNNNMHHVYWKVFMPRGRGKNVCERKCLILLPFILLNLVMPRFAEQVEVAIEALSANVPQPFEENEFIDASRLVYDGVRDIRKAVLMIRVCKTSGK